MITSDFIFKKLHVSDEHNGDQDDWVRSGSCGVASCCNKRIDFSCLTPISQKSRRTSLIIFSDIFLVSF